MKSTSKSVSTHHRRRHLRRKLGQHVKRSKGTVLHRIKTAPKKYWKGIVREQKNNVRMVKSLFHDDGPKKGKVKRLIKSAPKKYWDNYKRNVRNVRRTLRSF